MNDKLRRLLRWYPASWRDRYGEEFAALMDDELDGHEPTSRYRRTIIRAGLRERVHATGLVGQGADAVTRLRSGSLLVLSTWALFVLGGIEFSKTSEHFARAMPLASRASGEDAFNIVVIVAVVSGVAVALGAVATVPSAIAFLRSGGWPHMRRHVARSVAASALSAASVVALSQWAHHLNVVQRNGGSPAYSWAVGAFSLLVAATLASWTVTAVAIVTRLDLSRSILRLEGATAIVVTASMATITAATIAWWREIGTFSPWFLQGAPVGTASSPVSPNLVATVAIMLIAVLCATLGVIRITGAWQQLKRASS